MLYNLRPFNQTGWDCPYANQTRRQMRYSPVGATVSAQKGERERERARSEAEQSRGVSPGPVRLTRSVGPGMGSGRCVTMIILMASQSR